MLIGLSGKKQHGKSTVAKYLVDNHNFREVSWAMPLKEIIGKQLFGFTSEQLYNDVEKEKVDLFWEATPRHILQVVGTDCFRQHIQDDFWIKLGVRRIKEIQEYDPTMNVVVSDCRFLNEVRAIHELDGKVIRVIRTDLVSTDEHPSEVDLDYYSKFDAVFKAKSGEIDVLKMCSDKILKSWEKNATV